MHIFTFRLADIFRGQKLDMQRFVIRDYNVTKLPQTSVTLCLPLSACLHACLYFCLRLRLSLCLSVRLSAPEWADPFNGTVIMYVLSVHVKLLPVMSN